jgi:hypothetical protein
MGGHGAFHRETAEEIGLEQDPLTGTHKGLHAAQRFEAGTQGGQDPVRVVIGDPPEADAGGGVHWLDGSGS